MLPRSLPSKASKSSLTTTVEKGSNNSSSSSSSSSFPAHVVFVAWATTPSPPSCHLAAAAVKEAGLVAVKRLSQTSVTKAPAGNRRESLESALLHARACGERIQYVEVRQPRVHTYVHSVVAGMVWLGLAQASTRTVPSKWTKQEDQLLHKIRPFFSRPRHHAHGRRAAAAALKGLAAAA
jgi:hypothetical protein